MSPKSFSAVIMYRGKPFVLDDHANHSAKPAILYNPTSRDPKGWVCKVS